MVEEDMWTELHETARAPECVAIGECGLNYSKDFSEPSVQREVFKRQVCIHLFYSNILMKRMSASWEPTVDYIKL